MWVFGDQSRREAVSQKLARVRSSLLAAQAEADGMARHTHLISALIEAGEVAQGIADACFRESGGADSPASAARRAMALTLLLGRWCAHSWLHGLNGAPMTMSALGAKWAAQLPSIDVEIKQPEGYAFYALYPESYLEVARRLGAGHWRVVGLRSIGTSLAAIVAAILGDPSPLTLRPTGHPFDRRIEWRGGSLGNSASRYAVVDEGPGLSGSSMAAVIGHLRREGVAPGNIQLLTSHAKGPGAHAGLGVRELWSQSPSQAADFDADILHATQPSHRLQTWVEAQVGPLTAALEDVGGGRWRGIHRLSEAVWPPAHPWQERRKFLARSRGGTWLVKFAGLGHQASERMACAEALARAGFCPEVTGRCHGFLIERWRGDLPPLSPERLTDPVLRAWLLPRIADYLAFRAHSFPLPEQAGASLRLLCDMARHNTGEALGDAYSGAWARYTAAAQSLERRVQAIRTDSRMQVWEWLQCGARLLKTDAVDHHAGHDLVGCQDLAWDVAGTAVEFSLDQQEIGVLASALAERGCLIDEALLALYRAVYPAFQLGHASLAARDAGDDDEKRRLCARARFLTSALKERLAHVLL